MHSLAVEQAVCGIGLWDRKTLSIFYNTLQRGLLRTLYE